MEELWLLMRTVAAGGFWFALRRDAPQAQTLERYELNSWHRPFLLI